MTNIDETLIGDGTYFVHEAGGEIVACGGWSRRGKLFTGTADQESGGRDRLLDPGTEAAHIRAMFVRADWTRRDPAITRFIESRGRAGVPLYLWYEPGKAEPEELPQILTPGMLSERASRPR